MFNVIQVNKEMPALCCGLPEKKKKTNEANDEIGK